MATLAVQQEVCSPRGVSVYQSWLALEQQVAVPTTVVVGVSTQWVSSSNSNQTELVRHVKLFLKMNIKYNALLVNVTFIAFAHHVVKMTR